MIGIYTISNLITGKYYVGSSKDIRKRLISHRSTLKKGKHHNKHLQNAWSKYGANCFAFKTILLCDENDLMETEQIFLDVGFQDEMVYNSFKDAYCLRAESHPMYGKTHCDSAKSKIKSARSFQVIKHSAETREKIGNAHRGRSISQLSIQKMKQSKIGTKPWNKGKTRFTSESLKIVSENNRMKLSQEVIGGIIRRYLDGDSIEKIRVFFGIDWSIVKRFLVDSGIKTRSISQQKNFKCKTI